MALKLTRKGTVLIAALVAVFFLSISAFTLWYLYSREDDTVGPDDSQAAQVCCADFFCNDGTRFGEDYNYGGGDCSTRFSECDAHGGFSHGGAQMNCSAGDNCGGKGQQCCGGSECIQGLSCNGGYCGGDPNLCSQHPNCKSSCGTSGCSISGSCPSDVKVGAAYCKGKRDDGCNENNSYKTNMTGNIVASDPENWCSTVQADVRGSCVEGDKAIVVYIGDGGKVCHENDAACVNSLDWDCSPPVEEVQQPYCGGLSITSSAGPNIQQVPSLTEQLTFTVQGGIEGGGTPEKLAVYAAVNGQDNSQLPGGAIGCTASNYYCKGTQVWILLGEAAGTQHTFQMSYNEIVTKLASLTSFTQDQIRTAGVVVTANVTGQGSGDICSSNIAYRNGAGVMYNGGAWDTECQGNCVRWLLPPNAPPPPPPTELSCNSVCTSSTQCPSAYSCINGRCRNPQCENEADCTCAPPPIPVCGDGVCNQASEKCEFVGSGGVSCSTQQSVSCRDNCTYCGDGVLNGNEQCDDGNNVDSDSCRNNCTLPNCGDGVVDDGEECDLGVDNGGPECSVDCKVPRPPSWSVEKLGQVQCVSGKDVTADVFYKITVKNTGTGLGEVEKVIDTLDPKMQANWLITSSVDPASGVFANNLLTWMVDSSTQTLQPDEVREFLYQLNIPQSGFGKFTNTAEMFPVDGNSVKVTNEVNVMCAPLPETGLLDSSIGKIGIGLLLISLSGLYFYFEGMDGTLMRLLYKEEKVIRSREDFEEKVRNGK